MGRIFCAAVVLLALACLAYATDPVAVVKTTDGRTYNNVTVLKVEGDTVLLVHSEGAAKVPLSSLSDETRKALGLRTRMDEAAFEAEQAKKGLVKSGKDWVTPEEKRLRERPIPPEVVKFFQACQAEREDILGHLNARKREFEELRRRGDNDPEYLGWCLEHLSEIEELGRKAQDALKEPGHLIVPTLNVKYLETGDTGKLPTNTTVIQVLPEEKAALLDCDGTTVRIEKLNIKDLTDGAPFALADPVIVTGTATYLSARGSTRTVFVVKQWTEYRQYYSRYREALKMASGRQPPLNLEDWGRFATPSQRAFSPKAVDETAPSQQDESPPASKSAGLDNARGFGTGFAITDDGYIITAYHVIRDAKSVRVKTETELVAADVVAEDKDNDLALLKVDRKTDCITFTAARVASLGQTVFTVGFPMPDLQGFSPKVTKGVISGLKGIKDDVRKYQIDASIQPGNSGGPLADESGNLVGIVVSSLNDAAVLDEKGVVPQNVNYCLKLSYVLALVDANPDVAKKIHVAKDNAKVPFEEAVEKVRKATVIVASYADVRGSEKLPLGPPVPEVLPSPAGRGSEKPPLGPPVPEAVPPPAG